MSSIYNHLRQGRDKNTSELEMFIRAEVELQERLETMGYRSPTWRLLRALQSLHSAVQLQGESAVTAPPFFPSAGRGTTKFRGKKQGPTVFMWESLDEGGREKSGSTSKRRLQAQRVRTGRESSLPGESEKKEERTRSGENRGRDRE